MLIFASGRLVITGGRCLRSINAVWKILKHKLQGFLKPSFAETVTSKKRRTVQG